MFLALVVLGAAHGLVLLPILLVSCGPGELEHWAWRLRQQLELLASARAAAAAAAVVEPGQQQGQREEPEEHQEEVHHQPSS